MSYWLTDYELFLYAKGHDDVILRRCKKLASSSSSSGSSLVVPMKSDDFDYVSNVENHLELIGGMSVWEEPDYKRLVKYIYENRLLVNGQGLVIAEIYKLGDTNEIPIYIRSLDVLPLKRYIPNLMEQPIPLRTVKLLGDVNGKAAVMKEDSNVTKLTTRVADLESDLAITTGNVADLQSDNKTLVDANKTLEGKVTKLTADLMTALTTLQQQVKNINDYNKEAWMKDLTNSEWVGIEGLSGGRQYENLIIVGNLSTFTVDDNTTNVKARYWYKIRLEAGNSTEYRAIFIDDLTPNKEKARFLLGKWYYIKSKGKTYAFGSI